jgi:hypothetical protein
MWTKLATVTALTCLPAVTLAQAPATFKATMQNIHDPQARCNAVKVLVPDGWKVNGGIQWRFDRASIAYLSMCVYEPDGDRQVEFLPLLSFQWHPDWESLYRRGTVHTGMEMQPPVSDVRAFAQDHIVPRFRNFARIVSVQELPGVARTVAERESVTTGLKSSALAGRVRLEYSIKDKRYEEDVYFTIVVIQHPLDPKSVIWGTRQCYRVCASKGQLDASKTMLESIALSPRLELEWYNIYSQIAQQWFRNELYKIQQEEEMTRVIASMNKTISDQSRKMWRDWSDSRSAATDRFVDAIKGIERYESPYLNQPIEMPAGYRSAWVDAQGRYLLSDQVSYDPNGQVPGTWRQLKRSDR